MFALFLLILPPENKYGVRYKNYIGYGIAIVVASVAILIAMHQLPTITIAGVQLRGVDMLSQLRSVPTPSDDSIAIVAPPTKKQAYVDSCPEGVKCIDDYSTDECGMLPLYHALHNVKGLNRPVRIAVMGDSYIEGDILTGELREMLQKRFGGCGVGFVPMANESHGFRRTVLHNFNGWTEHSAVTPHGYHANYASIPGYYFTPSSGAYTEVRGQKKYCSLLDSCHTASILFRSLIPNTITVTTNGTLTNEYAIDGSNRIQHISVNGRLGKVRFRITNGGDSVMCYGVTMDPRSGVILDNYALRASSGEQLRNLSHEMLSQLNQLRHYDLVILMYGLNVANTQQTNYSKYHDKMCLVINHLKQAMPNTGFLVVSVADREENVDGVMKTMRGIKQLIAEQQHIAADEGVAFWNMFEAMGGTGSIVKMVNERPRKANLDYTHINHLGGRQMAKYLYDAIIAGYDNYLRRLSYEAEY